MLLCAVSVLIVAQPSSEVPEGLMNYPVYYIPIWSGGTWKISPQPGFDPRTVQP